MMFKDRQNAGQKQAQSLQKYKNDKNAIILALPRGGVVNGFEIAKKLNLSLDLVVTRKIGAPLNEEYAIGAITETGQGIFNTEAIKSLNISQDYIDKEVAKEKKEAQRRLKTYRQDRPPLDLKGKTVIIADDGIATGSTMRAAIVSVKAQKPYRIIISVPVSSEDSLKIIAKEVDEVNCLDTPMLFGAVGQFYKTFEQTKDRQVIDLMEKAKNFGK